MSSPGTGAPCDSLRVTMIRCSTLLLEWAGARWLTDPWFGMHLRGLPCFRRPGLGPEAVGPLDAVLVSHLHPDHIDLRALSVMGPRPLRVLVPPGAGDKLPERAGLTWEELGPGSETTSRGATIHAVPGPHTLPGPEEVNFVLDLKGWGRVFFGGDARFDGQVLARVGQRFGPFRLALLPVGGTRILGRRTVMGPEDALNAALLLDAAVVIPIHEGGIWMSVPPLSLHPGRAHHLVSLFERIGQRERVVHLQEGKSRSFPA